MPHLTTDDGVNLYYEEVGRGIPIVFVHEFAGDFRSRFDRGMGVGFTTDIASQSERPAAGPCDRLRNCVHGYSVEVETSDCGASCCERGGDGAADSTAGASYNCSPTCK